MLSRIARMPLPIPQGVEVTINGSTVIVKGKLGSLENQFNDTVTVSKKDNTLVLETKNDTKTTSSTIRNHRNGKTQ